MTAVALTGTPGTGKTTVSALVADRLGLEVVHLNDAIREAELFSKRDVDRDSLVADLDAVEAWLADYQASGAQVPDSGHRGNDRNGDHDGHRDNHLDVDYDRDGGDDLDASFIVESHLAHLLDADRVIILRCHPESLKPRLRERGESEASVAENAESEALDTILAAAVDRHGRESVWEVDTTDRAPEAVADDVVAAIRGKTDPRVGVVDFIEYL